MIETTRHINIVLEFAEGGELFDSMVNEEEEMGKLDERDAKFQFYQICCTIAYLHRYDYYIEFLSSLLTRKIILARTFAIEISNLKIFC